MSDVVATGLTELGASSTPSQQQHATTNAIVRWRYGVEIDDEEDCSKRSHFATSPEGVVVEIDHSPYEHISPAALLAHIALGFPERPHEMRGECRVSFPWRNATILAAHAAQAAL